MKEIKTFPTEPSRRLAPSKHKPMERPNDDKPTLNSIATFHARHRTNTPTHTREDYTNGLAIS